MTPSSRGAGESLADRPNRKCEWSRKTNSVVVFAVNKGTASDNESLFGLQKQVLCALEQGAC